jgi:hypothetical protein
LSKHPLFTTAAEYDEFIAATKTAMLRILLIGEETKNDSGGSSRESREAKLESLADYIRLLQAEKKDLTGEAPDESIFLDMAW